jgi:hypothetical protein
LQVDQLHKIIGLPMPILPSSTFEAVTGGFFMDLIWIKHGASCKQPGTFASRVHRDADRLRAVVAPAASLRCDPVGLGVCRADVSDATSDGHWLLANPDGKGRLEKM